MFLRSFVKTAIIGWLVLAMSLLSGCSLLRLTYPQVPTLAYWWLDGYADFSSAQAARVREQLGEWMRWNRSAQLPDYAALLVRARSEVQADATPAQVCRWYDEIAARIELGFDQAVPAVAEIALTLTPAQLDHMERKFAKSDAEFRTDYLQTSTEARRKETLKRTLERSELLYGNFDDAQREWLARELLASPFDADLWLAERRLRQRDILQTVRRLQAERASPAQAQAALRTLSEQAQRSPREAYRNYQQRLKQFNCALVARVHNRTTAAQRLAAAETLKGWESDLRALASETPP